MVYHTGGRPTRPLATHAAPHRLIIVHLSIVPGYIHKWHNILPASCILYSPSGFSICPDETLVKTTYCVGPIRAESGRAGVYDLN